MAAQGYSETKTDNVAYIDVMMRISSYQTLSLRSFTVYSSQLSSTNVVDMDIALLDFSDLSKEPVSEVTSAITFPTNGVNGSIISWEISDTSVINQLGEVTRSESGDSKCLLTATVSYNGKSKTKEFDVTVKQLSKTPMPVLTELICENTLKSIKQSDMVSVIDGTPKFGADGISLKVDEDNVCDMLSLFHNNARDAYYTPVVYEINVYGDNVAIEAGDTNEYAPFAFRFENNAIYASIRETYDSDAQWVKVKDGVIDGRKLVIATDPDSGMMSAWYGDDKIVNQKIGAIAVGRIQKLTARQISGTSRVSDFRAYYASLPQDDAIAFDAASLELRRLTWQSADKIWDNMELPTTGSCGSSILWSSTDEKTISTSGVVTPPETGSKSVTITATLTNGTATTTVSHNLTVVAHVKDEMPELKKAVHAENFDDNNPKTAWSASQSTGTIKTMDERRILDRTMNGSALTGTTFSFNSAYLQGIYVVEFTLRKTNDGVVYIRADGKKDYFHANWAGGGNLRVYNTSDTNKSKIVGNFGTEAKFTVLMNTPKSTFTLWVNDKMICQNWTPRGDTSVNIRSIQFYTNGTDEFTTVEIDNAKFYEAYPLYEERVDQDYDVLKELMLYNPADTATQYGLVTKDLVLPSLGTYGSNIKWSSSDPDFISDDGVVTPGAEEKTVTLTATISAGDGTAYEKKRTKELFFTVASNAGEDDMAAVQAEADRITYDVVARDENGSKQIKRSLNFISKGVYGSDISWSTSDPVHITSSGRVVCPRYNEENAVVTVTATIKRGGAVATKDFEFTVIADAPFKDPEHMPDEEFFGVWDGSKWTTEPKFNYDFKDSSGKKVLTDLCNIVKEIGTSGDYTAAKAELLNYFQNVRSSYSTVSVSSRNTGWANLIVDDFYHQQRSSYYQGSGYLSPEWGDVKIPVSREDLTAGVNVAYSVQAWYNESSYATFGRHNDPVASHRPRLELTVNGEVKTFEAQDTIEIRGGEYHGTNFGDEEYLTVQTFGDFQGNDTRHAKVRFNLTGLRETDVVTKAVLVLYGRAEPHFAGDKRIAVLKEPDSTWTSDIAKWDDFVGYIYSMNGLPDDIKPTWEFIDGADTEYIGQVCRFYAFPAIGLEYRLTGNDYYAYKAQRIIENFISKTGAYLNDHRNYDYANEGRGDNDGVLDLRGGFPRTLDAALRMQNWNQCINDIVKSPYATPDFITAMLKSQWDTYTYLTHYNTDSGNWRQFEHQSMLDGSIRVPEFAHSKDGDTAFEGMSWYDRASAVLEKMLFDSNFEDGSYVEACNGYSVDAFSGYVNYKADLLATGNDVSEEYDKLLHSMAYYQAALYTNDGQSLSYGDAGESTRPTSSFNKVIDWYDDDVLRYIISYGAKGTKPTWTSQTFPSSLVTVMRADWSKTSPYLFTNVRGGGQHGHTDYNGIILSAYNRILLTDAGKFTYDSTDPYRVYAMSTRAHNTVMINDASQRKITAADGEKFENANGAVLDFTTNSSFDFLRQSSTSYAGFDHIRNITFIKPDIWIVSDRINPTDTKKQNNYKQLWHMLPGAGLEISEDNRTVRSNFETGANIIIAGADESAATKETMGYYDRGYQVVEPAPYGYFEKRNAAGTTTFDTVIAVNNEDPTASLTSEKLITNGDATAVKFNITKNGEKFVGYYRMSYDGSVGEFGNYKTDAQLSFVMENIKGEVVSVLIKDGSYVKTTDGAVVLESDKKVAEVYADLSGTNAYITTDSEADASQLKVFSKKTPIKLYINDEVMSFTKNGNYITGIGGDAVVPQKPNNGVGIVDSPSGGGGGSAGGSGGSIGGGGSVGGGTTVPTPGTGTQSSLSDMSGHWAESYVSDLHSKGIVKGDTAGNYNPDSSITRAEFVAMVTRSLGIANVSYSGTFADVASGDWFAQNVQAALDYNLISVDNSFRPNDLITRQEMAKIIVGAADLIKKYETAESKLDSISDTHAIHDWAKVYVDAILKSGLMKGRTDGGFYPLDNATRAESAAVISRMLSLN
ncbi:MAG: hypothetical protein E7395_04230 [Ruminococcaceae bacterium]|nr:hypothetical protein [Oscillospiraceae bacterium]